MKDYFRVSIWQDFATAEIKMVFLRYHRGGKEVLNLYNKKTEVVAEGDSIPADYIITLPRFFADEILKALAQALDEQNIKTDADAKIQGLLDATRYHLEDMRKIALFNFSVLRPG